MKHTQGWIQARVGCHWFRSDRQIAISTIAYSPVDHYPQAAYGVWVDRELVTEFPSLEAAQRFADDAFPIA